EAKAYPITLKASLNPLKPNFLKPRESYFERYRPARMSFSLVAIRCPFRTITAYRTARKSVEKPIIVHSRRSRRPVSAQGQRKSRDRGDPMRRQAQARTPFSADACAGRFHG